jgi:hypothetical protein
LLQACGNVSNFGGLKPTLVRVATTKVAWIVDLAANWRTGQPRGHKLTQQHTTQKPKKIKIKIKIKK